MPLSQVRQVSPVRWSSRMIQQFPHVQFLLRWYRMDGYFMEKSDKIWMIWGYSHDNVPNNFQPWRRFLETFMEQLKRHTCSQPCFYCRNLNWRYLPYIIIYKAYVRGYTPKIWPYMVQYLHFRILEFPLKPMFFIAVKHIVVILATKTLFFPTLRDLKPFQVEFPLKPRLL